jgi:O-methyltransferase
MHDLSTNFGAELYLDLLRDCLTRSVFPEPWLPAVYDHGSWQNAVMAPIQKILRLKKLYLCYRYAVEPQTREFGQDWPPEAETMIGLKRLGNLRHCCLDVLRCGIPGDFCETGVWRGGACIYMRGILKAYGVTDRRVWVCDSFEGLPKPTLQSDAGLDFWTRKILAVGLEEVKANFSRYGLLDEQVQFVKGWFKDSLPGIGAKQLAVLRLDGELYESTWDAISNLYPKLQRGGYLIVDDYSISACKEAISDYREQQRIVSPIQPIDGNGVFWQV